MARCQRQSPFQRPAAERPYCPTGNRRGQSEHQPHPRREGAAPATPAETCPGGHGDQPALPLFARPDQAAVRRGPQDQATVGTAQQAVGGDYGQGQVNAGLTTAPGYRHPLTGPKKSAAPAYPIGPAWIGRPGVYGCSGPSDSISGPSGTESS